MHEQKYILKGTDIISYGEKTFPFFLVLLSILENQPQHKM